MGELTPLSVEEFGEAKRLHHLSTHPDEGKQCSWCGDTWPCDTSRLIAMVEELTLDIDFLHNFSHLGHGIVVPLSDDGINFEWHGESHLHQFIREARAARTPKEPTDG